MGIVVFITYITVLLEYVSCFLRPSKRDSIYINYNNPEFLSVNQSSILKRETMERIETDGECFRIIIAIY